MAASKALQASPQPRLLRGRPEPEGRGRTLGGDRAAAGGKAAEERASGGSSNTDGDSQAEEQRIYIGDGYERQISEDAGGPVTRHLYKVSAAGRQVAQVEREQRFGVTIENKRYIHGDHLGSSQVITDGDGNLVHVQRFDPFGKAITPASGSGDLATKNIRAGFTGHETDVETGLVNMRGRIYDPRIGRFMQADPILQPGWSQTLNRYSYVANNPLNATDPTGLRVGKMDGGDGADGGLDSFSEGSDDDDPIEDPDDRTSEEGRTPPAFPSSPGDLGPSKSDDFSGGSESFAKKPPPGVPADRKSGDSNVVDTAKSVVSAVWKALTGGGEKGKDAGPPPPAPTAAKGGEGQTAQPANHPEPASSATQAPSSGDGSEASCGEDAQSGSYEKSFGYQVTHSDYPGSGILQSYQTLDTAQNVALAIGLSAAASALEAAIVTAAVGAVVVRGVAGAANATKASAGVPRSVGAMAKGTPRILQTGGRTIQKDTARVLNQLSGRNLPARDWGRALENLKTENALRPNHHGRIAQNGDYLDDTGQVIDNILDYVP